MSLHVEISQSSKTEMYQSLVEAARSLLSAESDIIANMANISALLFSSLAEINWAGFYLYKNGELVLGPFQGKLACTRIKMGRGVCGTAAATRTIQCVEDVNAFPSHIACDSASRSELVVPILSSGTLFGVLDVDSPVVGRFDHVDIQGLGEVAALVGNSVSQVSA